MKKHRPCSEEEIIEGILSANQQQLNVAIRCLYDRHLAPVKDLVRRSNGSSLDADDVVQVVVLSFIKAVQAGQYRSQAGVGVEAFLVTLAKYHWRSTLRQREQVGMRETEYYQNESNDLIDEGTLDHLYAEEERAQYLRQFNQLGERCRQILTAQRRDGLSMKEIAELMGFENERVAIKEKFKCLQKLKNLLQP